MKKLHSFIIGISLVMIAIFFVVYALHHPEASFPWSNKVTFIIYGAYVGLIFNFLIAIPFRKKSGTISHGIIATILYVMLVAIFVAIALTDKTVSIYTVLQGFIIFISCDLAIENVRWYLQHKGANNIKE